MEKYQICNRCVMDTSDPEIHFDDDGNCNHCNEYLNVTSKKAYRGHVSDLLLKKLIKKIKKKGKKKKYDCLIGVSGGVDSSYVAYLSKNLGLRILAVHIDNGWNSREAVSNIKNVCDNLNIDYFSYVIDWKEFSDIQLSILRSSIVEVEIPTDIAVLGAIHKIAAKYKIKYIISGGNYATEGILPKKWFYDPKDFKLLNSIQKKFGNIKIKSFPYFDYKKEFYYKIVKGIKIIYILNYVPFSKEDAKKTLKEKLNYENYGGKHYESVFTSFVQSYYQYEKFNLDYRRATFSVEICENKISRNSALKELRSKPYNSSELEKNIEYICKKFGISKEVFDDIFKTPPRSYKDYPNNEKKLKFIYSIYNKFFN